MATDLSGATVGEFQAEGDVVPRAELVTLPDVQPDMTKHDPVTFAGLTGQRALQMQHDQGLYPTPEEIKAVEKDSLAKAQEYWSHTAEQAQRERGALAARQAAVTPGVTAQGIRIPSIAEQEEAVKAAAAERQKQWEQGPGAVARATELAQAGTPGEIRALGADDLGKLDAMTNAYDAVDNLGQYFNKMMEKPRLGVGGQIRSLGGRLQVLADATSPEALAFSRAKDAALVPIGRGVMGETGASPTKEAMIELAQHTTMPRIEDDDLTGNQGVFQLKQRIMQNLQNLRDNRYNNGFDTTSIDKAIAKYNSNFISPAVQKYNPLASQSNDPLVQSGSSDQANRTINSVNAGANAGVPLPASAQAAPNQIPQSPAPNKSYVAPPSYGAPPSLLQQGTQEDIAATIGTAKKLAAGAGAAGQLYHGAATGMLSDIGTLGRGAGDVWNWLNNLQVTYPPNEKPWDTATQQVAGNQ